MPEYTPPKPYIPPGALQAKVEAACTARGWAYLVKATDCGSRTQLVLEAEEELWTVTLEVWDAIEAIVVRARPQLLAPSARRSELMILLTQVNEGLVFGNAELDLETGAVAFKASLDASTFPEVPIEAVEGLIDSAMRTAAVYWSAIQAVVLEGESAEVAYQMLAAADEGDERPGAPDPDLPQEI